MTGTMEAQRILDDVPMTRLQIAAVVLCVALNAIDGFDVLAISFAAPGIAAEWGISRGALGIVLAMELIGMAAGSVVLGSIADNLGRRPIILGCLVVMASGMYLASQATSVNALLATRFVTGVGIGGMLATTNAMVAEYSNARHRNFNVVLMATGYPVGIIIGGSLATILLAHFDWRAVFILGAAMTGVLLPAIWFLMPESISYLAQKKRPDALAQINRILTRMGHAVLEQLPASEEKSTGWRDLFSPQLARTTILLTTAYLAHIITFYFILKWIPNIVVDMEYSPASAGGILVWANVGGAVGSVLLGGLTHYFRLRSLIITALDRVHRDDQRFWHGTSQPYRSRYRCRYYRVLYQLCCGGTLRNAGPVIPNTSACGGHRIRHRYGASRRGPRANYCGFSVRGRI